MSGTIGANVPTKALWTWSTPVSGQAPIPVSYPTKLGVGTKSGLQPSDLSQYLLMPLQQFGNPPIPVPDSVVTQWIRYAEDEIESATNIRLCQTWIAAPPAKSIIESQQLNVGPQTSYQQLGVDYDVSEAAYDFFF